MSASESVLWISCDLTWTVMIGGAGMRQTYSNHSPLRSHGYGDEDPPSGTF
jgi:hypothetical protein